MERVVIPLKAGQSSATYRVRDGDLQVNINTSHGSESARLAARRPQPPPAQNPDAVHAEVARLEQQLQQLREAAVQGRTQINALSGRIFNLSSQASPSQ